MPISIHTDIMPQVEAAAGTLKLQFPDHASAIDALVTQFRHTYGNRILEHSEQGTFCTTIGAWVETRVTDNALKAEIKRQRLEIFGNVMHAKSAGHARLSTHEIFSRQHPSVPRNAPLPPRTKAEITEVMQQFAQLAVYIGDSVALDILEMIQILRPGERTTALDCISRYLGENAPSEHNTIIGILQLPEDILQNLTVREKIHRSLVEYCYRALMAKQADTLENQPRCIAEIDAHITQCIHGMYQHAFGLRPTEMATIHADIFYDVLLHFRAAAALEIPAHMAQTTTDHHGVTWPLGSWRQRLALTEVLDPKKRHMYIGFDAGHGKTFTHIWAYELIKKQREAVGIHARTRMLFIAPKAVISEIPNRIRRGSASKEAHSLYYPDPNQAPSVGVIQAGMTLEQIQEAASRDIVFCAYSMWGRKRTIQGDNDAEVDAETAEGVEPETIRIIDILLNQNEPFQLFSCDESHLLQGGNTYTQLASETITTIPGLQTEGHILFGSATPAPGHLSGIRITLELLEDIQRRTELGERKHSSTDQWAQLRRMLGKLWMMDEPETWMDTLEYKEYDLSLQEQQQLQIIVDDTTMPALQKMHLLLLAIRCPRLVYSNANTSWSSFDATIQNVTDIFNDGDNRTTILIAENMLSSSVLRPAGDVDEDALNDANHYFFTALQTWCDAHGIHMYIIHGETPEEERIQIYATMQQHKASGQKSILYAQSACLNLGIDLRFLDAIISQQWPYNTPDLYQLFKRANRMGNTHCRVIVSYAKQTVEEGILTSAHLKYFDVQRCLHGVILSNSRMEQLTSKEAADTTDDTVASRLESIEQRVQRFQRVLHGAGNAGTKEFWKLHPEDFLQILAQSDSSAIGDNDRILASLVRELELQGIVRHNGAYLHTASVGQGFARYIHSIPNRQHQTTIQSLDATEHMLDYGHLHLPETITYTNGVVATPDQLSTLVQDDAIPAGSKNIVILQGLEQTSHSVQTNGTVQMTGRIRALIGAVRALQLPSSLHTAGILIIPLCKTACTADEYKQLKDQLLYFGLEVMETYTGTAVSQDNFDEPATEMYVITARRVIDFVHSDIASISAANFVLTQNHKPNRQQTKKRKLPYSLPHQKFKIGRKPLQYQVPIELQAEKLAYLERLTQAVTLIRGIATSSSDMMTKLQTAAVKTLLSDHQIICLPHFRVQKNKKKKQKQSTSDARIAFKFTDSTNVFYPFDEQWNTVQ